MSDMPERVRRCTTHHHACDCREYEFEQAKVRIEELTAEIEEQARLLGASGSREAELLARVEALEKDFAYHAELCTSQQARIEALEDFNYRRRKAYRDRVIDALHNMDTEESPELEDVLNLAHNAIYNAVTKALLEGE